jgi:FimV-like protein
MLQLAEGDLNAAHRTFESALKGAPGDPQIRYHLALATAKMGDKRQAAQILKAVLSSGGEFESREEAQDLLDELNAR